MPGSPALHSKKTLVVIPTLNERDNVQPLCEQLLALNLGLDILFIDDNSPDGTGRAIDELAARYPQVSAYHRPSRLGLGTAHLAGIEWAYDHGYELLITMDCDMTHPPEYLREMLLRLDNNSDVIIASRHLLPGSIPEWSVLRKLLAKSGHLLTKILLRMPYDATGAFRLYRLEQVPRQAFRLVRSRGYSFLFESAYVLHVNGLRIKEIPAKLPPRSEGSSKMNSREVARSVKALAYTFLAAIFVPSRYRLPKSAFEASHRPLKFDMVSPPRQGQNGSEPKPEATEKVKAVG